MATVVIGFTVLSVFSGSAAPRNLAHRVSVGGDGANACTKYKGPRLYASTFDADQHVRLLTWKLSARGSTPPICIVDPAGLGDAPGGMVVGSTGKLWVMDSINASLDAFPEGSNGDVSPSQAISGSNTGLLAYSNGNAQHPAVDSTGNIWVPEWYGYNGYLVEFSEDAIGNVAPIATIGFGDKGLAEGFDSPSAITFDSAGNLYAVNSGTANTVLVFSPPFYDTEQPVAVWHTGQAIMWFMASDGTNVYAATTSNLLEFKGGLSSGGNYRNVSLFSTRGHGLGEAADLKTDSRGRVLFPMLFSPIKRGPGAVGILPPSPKSLKGYQYILNSFNEMKISSIAISP